MLEYTEKLITSNFGDMTIRVKSHCRPLQILLRNKISPNRIQITFSGQISPQAGYATCRFRIGGHFEKKDYEVVVFVFLRMLSESR